MTAYTFARTDRLNCDYEHRVEVLRTNCSSHHLRSEVS